MFRFFIYGLLLMTIFSQEIKIDDELKPYVKDFFTISNKYCKIEQYNLPPKMTITFTDRLGKGVIGVCGRNSLDFEIILSRGYWDNFDESDRFSLFMHEAMHCYLKQDHVADKHNFMFAYYYRLGKEEVIEQMKVLVKDKCQN